MSKAKVLVGMPTMGNMDDYATVNKKQMLFKRVDASIDPRFFKMN